MFRWTSCVKKDGQNEQWKREISRNFRRQSEEESKSQPEPEAEELIRGADHGQTPRTYNKTNRRQRQRYIPLIELWQS